MRRRILILAFILLVLLSVFISQQKVQLENTNEEWEATEHYQWNNNGEIRFGVDYKIEKPSVLVFLRGTSNTSNQEIVVDDYYVENQTLKIETSLKNQPRLGTRAVHHPDKVVRVFLSTDIKKIEHKFADHGSVSVEVEDLNIE